MKNYKWIIVVFLLTAGTILLFGSNLKDKKYLSQTEAPKAKTVKKIELMKVAESNKKDSTMPKDHSKQSIDCKTCHYCEYPTITDPCLLKCPRTDMVSIHHSVDEGPEIVEMNMIKGDYGVVVFSHKLHAEMSEMSGGCQSCHHYNTTGPVLKCITCHEPNRIREDLTKPDLEAAYHRQCLSCHRQWSRETKCQACHINEKSPDRLKAIQRIKNSKHPQVHEPEKVVYETNSDKGKFVTFYHDQHVGTYNIACINCHKDENCMRCHDVNIKKLRTNAMADQHIKVKKSFDEHHAVCSTCHEKNDCNKCHQPNEMKRFDHYTNTGFNLNPRHSRLSCNMCHKQQGVFKGLSKNCTSCHSNFVKGKFDHRRIGIEFDETHTDLECSDCHKGSFDQKPNCTDCHDDKSFPANLPGKKISIQPAKDKKIK
jgi:hypothetical protein